MELFKGIAAAMVTPFGRDGNIDYDVFGRYVEHLIAGGVSALVPFGTTGEPATLSPDEYAKGIEFVVKRVGKRVPVIVGAGSNSTATAVEHASVAAKLGADGLLVVTPYYNKCTQRGIIEHYKAVAAVGTPIIVYNVPSRTGVNIEPCTLEELAKLPNIVGIKEASGNIDRLQSLAAVCDKTGLSLYCGDDGLTVVTCALGGSGVISVAANPAPQLMARLYSLCGGGDYAAARKLQFELDGFIDALFCEVNPIPAKKAMQLLGFEVGAPRLPLTEMEKEHTAVLRDKMKELDLL